VQLAGRATAPDAFDFEDKDAGDQDAKGSGSQRGSGSLRKRAAASDAPEGEGKKQKTSGGRGNKKESKETVGLSAEAVEAVEDASAQRCGSRALCA